MNVVVPIEPELEWPRSHRSVKRSPHANYAARLRPWMIRISRTTSATARRMWMNPPSVYELTTPTNHSKRSTTNIVQSMSVFLISECGAHSEPAPQTKPCRSCLYLEQGYRIPHLVNIGVPSTYTVIALVRPARTRSGRAQVEEKAFLNCESPLKNRR